ncbi:MAG: hypothetical protein DRI57_12810 [Deltaproteobacteria bacterium]|nr:MAG: hypothetical protein DRI57_12810 [Deltaproteobacteria bacterium]
MFRTGFLCRTGFFAGRGSLPDGVLCRTGFFAGRGLQPRLQCFVNPRQQMFRTGFLCRTGLQPPSGNQIKIFCTPSDPPVSGVNMQRILHQIRGRSLFLMHHSQAFSWDSAASHQRRWGWHPVL